MATDGRGGSTNSESWLRTALAIAIVAVVSFLGLLEAIGDETERIQNTLEASGGGSMWGGEPAYAASAPGDVPYTSVPEPAPEVEAIVEPVPPEPTPAPELTEVEATICGVFVGYCADALAVARCESGPDYYAPAAYYHVGTFQLAFRYHADKFALHGWDIWASGDDIYQNSVVAFEIFAGRGFSWLGTSGWPVCGWEAGY